MKKNVQELIRNFKINFYFVIFLLTLKKNKLYKINVYNLCYLDAF